MVNSPQVEIMRAIAAIIGAAAAVYIGIETYSDMYPVSSIQRYVLSLCASTRPEFIRAFPSNRESCFRKMPRDLRIAIGMAKL